MLLNRMIVMLVINDNEELLLEILDITKSKILNYINESELPLELEFVLIELAIQRYNRIGSEGVSSESVDGRTTPSLPILLYLCIANSINTNSNSKGNSDSLI